MCAIFFVEEVAYWSLSFVSVIHPDCNNGIGFVIFEGKILVWNLNWISSEYQNNQFWISEILFPCNNSWRINKVWYFIKYIPVPPKLEPAAPPTAPANCPNELAATGVGFPSEPTTVISPPKIWFIYNQLIITQIITENTKKMFLSYFLLKSYVMVPQA